MSVSAGELNGFTWRSIVSPALTLTMDESEQVVAVSWIPQVSAVRDPFLKTSSVQLRVGLVPGAVVTNTWRSVIVE
jgi:hypothetical protein